jgi:3-oxoacyl-[acyl-carrier protein] reductase
MLLSGKNAVVYGVGNSIGGAVARAFAKAGARVFLTARRRANAAAVAEQIAQAGGRCEVAEVDALDESAVNEHARALVAEAGSLDVSFNLINIQERQNQPLAEMSVADFTRPIEVAMRTQFLTTTAAARAMLAQRSGVILTLTATPGGIGYAGVGGFGPACCAIESLARDLAAELGPSGVRVVNLRSAGSADSRPFREALEQNPSQVQPFLDKIQGDTMLKRMPPMQDIANTAVFLASPWAASITGVTIDVTAGTTAALNYQVTDIAFLQK